MFRKILVANRGAVAARVMRTLDRLGIRSVGVYSEADARAHYLEYASETYAIGPSPARESYLAIDRLVEVARAAGADAVHPGYGFLSENPAFAERLEAAGVRFIGPSARWLAAMGHKTEARALMAARGVPIARGGGVLPADDAAAGHPAALAAARDIGYPVLVKPAAGGGGIGMLPAHDDAELARALASARALAERSFGSAEVYLEKLLVEPRHVEFQMVADRRGQVAHVFERDCSLQRRHQKLIEEATAPGLARAEVEALAVSLAAALADLGYDHIGTVEMLRGTDGTFSFLEMNTRLQVEHGVTEEITGLDLVEVQLRSAAGEPLSAWLPEPPKATGHAVEARVYAEHPRTFLPSPGRLEVFRPPHGDGLRVETGYAAGNEVTPYYDPLVAKVIARGATREAAVARLRDALEGFEIAGIRHNVPFLLKALASDEFLAGAVHTGLVGVLQARYRAAL